VRHRGVIVMRMDRGFSTPTELSAAGGIFQQFFERAGEIFRIPGFDK